MEGGVTNLALSRAVRTAALCAVTCTVLVTVFVLTGHGPWTRWVAPTLLIVTAVTVADVIRSTRAERGAQRVP